MELFKLKTISSDSEWFARHLMEFEDMPTMTLKQFIEYWFTYCVKYGYTHGKATVYKDKTEYGWFEYDYLEPIKKKSSGINDVQNYTDHLSDMFDRTIIRVKCLISNEDDELMDLFIYL